jgi:hypothetical protein
VSEGAFWLRQRRMMQPQFHQVIDVLPESDRQFLIAAAKAETLRPGALADALYV